MGPDAMILDFWMLSFKLAFSLSSFTFIKTLLSSLLFPRTVVFLRLLIFLPTILFPACVSSRPAFLMMYSACKLHKQCDNIQLWCTPFPILNKSVVPCLVLTVASWPAYRFLRRQVRWSGIPISSRIFQFVVICTIKGFSVVNEAEVIDIQSHHFMANRWGNNGNSDRLLFSWTPKSLQMVTAAMKLKDACSLEVKLWQT